ncbi:unnamed protein product, partial [Polarella glacialis]
MSATLQGRPSAVRPSSAPVHGRESPGTQLASHVRAKAAQGHPGVASATGGPPSATLKRSSSRGSRGSLASGYCTNKPSLCTSRISPHTPPTPNSGARRPRPKPQAFRSKVAGLFKGSASPGSTRSAVSGRWLSQTLGERRLSEADFCHWQCSKGNVSAVSGGVRSQKGLVRSSPATLRWLCMTASGSGGYLKSAREMEFDVAASVSGLAVGAVRSAGASAPPGWALLPNFDPRSPRWLLASSSPGKAAVCAAPATARDASSGGQSSSPGELPQGAEFSTSAVPEADDVCQVLVEDDFDLTPWSDEVPAEADSSVPSNVQNE